MKRTDFWSQRLEVNAHRAIFHQWEQLEASGCIENFRIAAGQAAGLRSGWFFADSDAYKWLEAAARIWAGSRDPRLAALMDGFIELLGQAQAPDGYLFTYNQIHFPGVRWQNLQIEHELYCHGHLIEAGVSHHAATGRKDLLEIAQRAAGRIVADFHGKGPDFTPGHEEIEIALLRLHQALPGEAAYLELARQFIEQRGRVRGFALSIARQNMRVGRRDRTVQQKRREYLAEHPDFKPFELPPNNRAKEPANTALRWYASVLSGKYFQQQAPVREQKEPVGHSVRFAYLETAIAMLAHQSGDHTLLPALESAWERMVLRRMYVTGGLGSLPRLEGFGADFELDPETAYAETCAALGCLFWNWEMAQLTGAAKYSDLFEWQLYNAAAVGMGLDGTTYLYNNPLACSGGVTRQPWYAIPCCPSNISRTWAGLDRYVYSAGPGVLRVHQYLPGGSSLTVPGAAGGALAVTLEIETSLPWEGRARIKISELEGQTQPFELQLRQPSWAGELRLAVNGEPAAHFSPKPDEAESPASGYDPRPAAFCSLSRSWKAGDVVEIDLEMPLRLRLAEARVRGHTGKTALTRGPLVYCLEDVDNPQVDILTARLDPDSLAPAFDDSMLGGIVKIQGKTKTGAPLIFIPYFLWSNRGPSRMTVWVNT